MAPGPIFRVCAGYARILIGVPSHDASRCRSEPVVAKSEPVRLVATHGPPVQTNPSSRFCDRAALFEVLALAGKLAPHSNGLRAVLALLERRGGTWAAAAGEALLRRVVGAVMERLGVDRHGDLVEAGDLVDPVEAGELVEPLEPGPFHRSRSPPGEVERLLSFYGIKNEPWFPPVGVGQGSLFDP